MKSNEKNSKYHESVLDMDESMIPVLADYFAKFKNQKDLNYIYYKYYDINDLQKTLLNTKYIDEYNIIIDIINIICEYHGITQCWTKDETYKSNNIVVINSNDNLISYAIAERNRQNDRLVHDSILFNDWIDINCNKKIFRYLFKVNEHFYYYRPDHPAINIGIITKKFIKNEAVHIDNFKIDKTTLRHHYAPGFGMDGDSLGWYVEQNCYCYYKSKSTGDRIYTNWNKFENKMEINDINSYFLFEVNLVENNIRIISNAFKSESKVYKYSIPETLLNIINKEECFTIAYSIIIDRPAYFALGLVKLNC